jgi:Ser/Thr protein kinase RdoA (MazF antagonist)
MTSVLEASPPRFSPEEVAQIAADLFGLNGVATDLGSERDQTFLIDGPAGSGVVKISNRGEDPSTLDLEAAAILHIARVDATLPVARPRAVSTEFGAAASRAPVEGPEGRISCASSSGCTAGRRPGSLGRSRP